jgi:hypothetical protein
MLCRRNKDPAIKRRIEEEEKEFYKQKEISSKVTS